MGVSLWRKFTFAHEGHAHADDGIALWQIVTVVAAAVAVYFAVNAILNTILERRERRRNLGDGDSEQQVSRDRR